MPNFKATYKMENAPSFNWSYLSSKISNECLSLDDSAMLLSNGALSHLEEIANAAHNLTVKRFGKVMRLYAPVYLSNECINGCRYCGFNSQSKIERKTLSIDDAVRDANIIMDTGHRNILLVSGEHPKHVTVDYISSVAGEIRKRAASITIEVQPFDEASYEKLKDAGVDGVTMYQETYDEKTYAAMHPYGPKSKYGMRLDAMDAAASADMRFLGIGALLGLHDWRQEAIAIIEHAKYLMKKYWRAHVSISVPRIRDCAAGFDMPSQISDRELAHMICSMRLSLPDCGINLSTREPSSLRNGLMRLGVTQMSAGSVTYPGGYAGGNSGEQFHIEDKRSPHDVAEIIKKAGYDPIWKDWDRTFFSAHKREITSERI